MLNNCWQPADIFKPMSATNPRPSVSKSPLPGSGSARPASLDDVRQIYKLLKQYSDRGVLLPRPESDIYQSLREFLVIELDGKIVACAALQIFTHQLGEVRSLAVAPEFAGIGLGSVLVGQIESEAVRIGLTRLMALTYEVRFFDRLGYEVVDMKVLPEKVWGACINCHKFRNCDEIAVLKHLPTRPTFTHPDD